MIHPGQLTSRLWNSSVVWSWVFNGLRLSSVLILLPLLARFLTEPDYGFFIVLASLVSFVQLLDMGFLPAISRSVSYAMAGARELKAHGMESSEHNLGGPNFPLLWQLLSTTRALYQRLAIGVLLAMGAWGTFAVGLKIEETSDPRQAWLAWSLTLAGAVFEMYSGWWNTYLRGLNKVLVSTRILAVAYLLRLIIAAILLIAGLGLLSVPIATLISSFLQRSLSRRWALQFLAASPRLETSRAEVIRLLRVLWPNSWRVGVHCLTNSLVPHLNTLICMQAMGLAGTAQYGLSLQIMNVLQGMASVWVLVKWPVMGQYLSRRELHPLRALVRQRFLLQMASFAVMAAVAVPLSPWLLALLKTDKSVLPMVWMVLLTLYTFAETHLSSWATFVSLGNRLPFLPITVLTNAASVGLSLALFKFTSLGFGALVLGPLLAGAAHNYWRWPREGCRVLETSWTRLFFSRKSGSPVGPSSNR